MQMQEPIAAVFTSKDLHGQYNGKDETGRQDSLLIDRPQAASAVQPPQPNSIQALDRQPALKSILHLYQQAQTIATNIYAGGIQQILSFTSRALALAICVWRILDLLGELYVGGW